MTDRKALHDPNETPEDVATLYSWANLHGAKYRDFSASRAQNREKTRQRLQQEAEQDRERALLEAETQQTELARIEEQARRAEIAAQQAAQVAAQLAAQQAAQYAAQQAAQEIARQAAQQAAQEARAAQAQAAQHAQAAEWAARQAAQQASREALRTAPYPPPHQVPQQAPNQVPQQAPQQAPPQAPYQAAWQAPAAERYPAAAPASAPYASPEPSDPASGFAPASFATPQSYTTPAPASPYAPMREDLPAQSMRNPWGQPEQRENARPAWLLDRPEMAGSPVLPQTPEDTLQGSRDRLTSRWFALRGIFEGVAPPADAAPAPVAARPPALAVFSLAGGVGKTSLVATLGRALSARGERVLLVDTAAFGLLPFFFGARDQRPGLLRTFSPPAASGDAPIQMITIDPESLNPDNAAQEALIGEIAKQARGVGRVIIDLPTASGATTRRILKLSPLILVPVVPDMNSVVSVGSIDAFFEHNSNVAGKAALPYYVLNQYDPSLPLHLDVREVLREQVGERLLQFALRRAPVVSEALAEGMTVMDYAPNSTVAEDFIGLAGWVKSQSAPASSGFRGVRWSER